MQPDPVRLEDTREWISKAAQDLRRVHILSAADPSDIEGVLFHAQQAAEKVLKAFLVWHDVPFRKTHGLEEIGAQCASIDPTLANLIQRGEALTVYAWRFRYPGAPYQPDLEEAKAAADLAERVFEEIANRLPADTRP